MKINILKIHVIGIMMALSTAANAQGYKFEIHGTFKNMPQIPSKVYLSEIYTKLLQKSTDSVNVVNGSFVFKGEAMEDFAIGVFLSGDKNLNLGKDHVYQLIIDKGEIDINFNGSFNNPSTSGNGAAAENEFVKMRRPTLLAADTVNQMMADPKYKTDPDFQLKVRMKSNQMLGEFLFGTYNHVKANPNERVSPYLTFMLIDMPFIRPQGKDSLMQSITPVLEKTLYQQQITTYYSAANQKRDSLIKVSSAKSMDQYSKVKVGQQAPEFTENDPNGKRISLRSFRGKYVLIDFWASWCKPCREENPNVKKAYQTYKEKGFTVLGVSLDGLSSKTAWIKAIANDGLTWTNVSDLKAFKGQAATLYDIKLIPQNFLIDPSGKVVATNLRGGDLQTKLAELIK